MDFDIAIIGGGIVGCALARQISLMTRLSCVLLEKESDVLTGASGGNSAILHDPVEEDGDLNPIELKCVQQGSRLARALLHDASPYVPFRRCGALIVAWQPDQLARLPAMLQRAQRNGVADARILSRDEVALLEPHLSRGYLGALLVPGETVMDSWWLATLFLAQALSNGARLVRGFHVVSGQLLPGAARWRLQSAAGHAVTCGLVINAAGLFGDVVERIRCDLGGEKTAVPFEIKPRRGQFLVFAAPRSPLVHHVIYPVPSPTTKGILVTPTVHGPIFVGPTASEQQSRDDRSVDAAVAQRLHQEALKLCPSLASLPVAAEYVGIRPATQFTDYLVASHPEQRWITCAGIRSTGATGSLGVASHVLELLSSVFPSAQCAPSPDLDVVANTRQVARDLYHAISTQKHPGHIEIPSSSRFSTSITHPLSKLSLSKL